jgi:hypothetical protein
VSFACRVCQTRAHREHFAPTLTPLCPPPLPPLSHQSSQPVKTTNLAAASSRSRGVQPTRRGRDARGGTPCSPSFTARAETGIQYTSRLRSSGGPASPPPRGRLGVPRLGGVPRVRRPRQVAAKQARKPQQARDLSDFSGETSAVAPLTTVEYPRRAARRMVRRHRSGGGLPTRVGVRPSSWGAWAAAWGPAAWGRAAWGPAWGAWGAAWGAALGAWGAAWGAAWGPAAAVAVTMIARAAAWAWAVARGAAGVLADRDHTRLIRSRLCRILLFAHPRPFFAHPPRSQSSHFHRMTWTSSGERACRGGGCCAVAVLLLCCCCAVAVLCL